MGKLHNQRKEKRMRCNWPVWFSEDFSKPLTQAEIQDVSSGGLAFICNPNENCPYPGQNLVFRFSIPRFDVDGSFTMISFTRVGCVKRVEEVNKFIRRVAVEFDKPLSFKPGEQLSTEADLERIKVLAT